MIPSSGPASNFYVAILGIVIIAGVSSIQKRRHVYLSVEKELDTIGLVCVSVPKHIKDYVCNDVLLEKSIQNTSKQLYVYVEGENDHEILNYISDLYTLTWDLACLQSKSYLDIRIAGKLSKKQFVSLSDLILLPELNAVYGTNTFPNLHEYITKRLKHKNLQSLKYISLDNEVSKRLSHEYLYFEDKSLDLCQYNIVLLGGTFDHLHNGHKKLLSLAVSICRQKIVIGITSDLMLKKKSNATLIESWDKRKQNVYNYIKFLNPQIEMELVCITDPFGPSITIRESGAIVVSSETLVGADKINQIRQEKGYPKLQIHACRRTESSTLSSSAIRTYLAQENQI